MTSRTRPGTTSAEGRRTTISASDPPPAKLVGSGLPTLSNRSAPRTGDGDICPGRRFFSLLPLHHRGIRCSQIGCHILAMEATRSCHGLPDLRVRSACAAAAPAGPGRYPLWRRPHAFRGMMHPMQLRALNRPWPWCAVAGARRWRPAPCRRCHSSFAILTPMPWTVYLLPQAEAELQALPTAERLAVLNAAKKLEALG